MIIKYRKEKDKKKAHPFIGILLLFISAILFVLTVPLGIIYGIFYKLFTRSINGLGEFSLNIAVSIDQLGNVVMQYLLNHVMIVSGGYKFGNRDETISSVIGKNVEKNTLSKLGKLLNVILDFIDADHSLNSIDYYVEPISDKTKP
jgi:hypothetical protein